MHPRPAQVISSVQVMHAGFKLQDARVFTLDQSPPVTTITAATIPYQDSKRAAQFAFGATDMLPVGSYCNASP